MQELSELAVDPFIVPAKRDYNTMVPPSRRSLRGRMRRKLRARRGQAGLQANPAPCLGAVAEGVAVHLHQPQSAKGLPVRRPPARSSSPNEHVQPGRHSSQRDGREQTRFMLPTLGIGLRFLDSGRGRIQFRLSTLQRCATSFQSPNTLIREQFCTGASSNSVGRRSFYRGNRGQSWLANGSGLLAGQVHFFRKP